MYLPLPNFFRRRFAAQLTLIAAGLCTVSASALAAFPESTNLSGLDGLNGTRIDGVLSGDFLGESISAIGDFNGDGLDDFIIGAPNSGFNPGTAYVVYGNQAGLAFPINPSALLTTNQGFRIDGAVANSQLGASVANAGDLNGDNLADIIVGAPGESAAYVIFGRQGGYQSAFGVNSLNGANGFRLSGALNGRLGYSVASAGDINGDGLNDMVAANGSPNLGVAYVVFGSRDPFQAVVNAASLNGAAGFAINGAMTNQSGFVVNKVGDVNGDQVDDLIIGSWTSNAAYVLFGKTGPFAASASIYGLNGTNGFTLGDGTVSSNFGASVAGVGDVNADGFADMAIGAPMASTNSSNNQAGKTYIVFGSGAGFPASFNVSLLDGTNGGFQIFGAATRDRSGWSVANAGDINADGIADIAIGAPYSSYGGTVSGTSYVIFGKAGGFVSPLSLSGNPLMQNGLNGSNGFQLTSGAAAQLSGWAIAGAGDFNGDGADDLLIGARLANGFDGVQVLTNSGMGYVFYGQNGDSLPPVTAISPNPVANAFGWNNSAIALSVASSDNINGSGVKETRCALDPAAVPANFTSLASNSCAGNNLTAEGVHIFYAASIDNAGNQETPVSLTLKLDLSAPLVKVLGVANGAVYKAGKVPKASCSASDALSGLTGNATLTITGGNRKGKGQFAATCSGALDQAGNTGTATVNYTVK